MKHEKGGIWNAPNRRMTQFILSHNEPDNRLLCVGKSYGARDICETLLLISDKLKYDKVYLVTVDPAWIGSRHNKDVLLVPQCIEAAWNVIQWNRYPRGCHTGVIIESDAIRFTGIAEYTEIKNTDHFSIVTHRVTKDVLATAIKQICEGWR
jgi:hypothetical protein